MEGNSTACNSTDLIGLLSCFKNVLIYLMNDLNKTDLNNINLTEIHPILQVDWFYIPILMFLGVLGNSLSMYVFFCTKLCYSSSSIYLGALATSDTGFLIAIFAKWISEVNMTDLFERSGFCQFIHSLYICCGFLSVWLVVAFTVERYVAIKWPLRRRSLCTVGRAKIVVIVLVALTIPQCIPASFFVKSFDLRKWNITDMNVCSLNKNVDTRLLNIYNVFDTLIAYGVPMILIIIFNILIARNICKQDDVQRTMISIKNIASVKSDATNEKNLMSCNETSQIKITKMLLLVSSVFICLNTPWYIIRLIPNFYDLHEIPEDALFWFLLVREVGRLLYLTNYGINFILYCASGQNFRRVLIRIFKRHSNNTIPGETKLSRK